MRVHSVITVLILCLTRLTLGSQQDVVPLMTDQHRYDEPSVLGTTGAATPAIDQICRSGMMFTHVFVPTPQCSPARDGGKFLVRAGSLAR
jgi:hypothetical protein